MLASSRLKVPAITSMHDADHCICLRSVAYFVPKKERLHGYGPWVEKRSGGLQS